MKRSSDVNMTTFGKRLWSLRKSKGLRQQDLAKELGVSRDTISYYESKARNPTVEFVQAVADFFDVSIDELLREDSNRRIKPGPASKIEKQLDLIRNLPREKQKAISTMLDMALQSESISS